MGKSIVAILVLAVLGCTHAQLKAPGPCPAVQVQPNFNLTAFLGKWYEQTKFPVPFEANRKCIQAEYTLQTDGNLGVKNSGVNINSNVRTSTVGYAVPVANAKLKVVFPTSPPSNDPNFWILETDYTNYRIIYNCRERPNATHDVYAWISARTRTGLSPKLFDKAIRTLKSYKIDTNKLVKTEQYPECEEFYKE